MNKLFMRSFVSLALLVCIVCSLLVTIQNAEAALPIHHSTPTVLLSIKFGRIYFTPNALSCSHNAKPCFNLKYVSNDGLRPVWLNGTQEYILRTGQIIPFTFPTPGIELFTLFQHSVWWKIKVTVL